MMKGINELQIKAGLFLSEARQVLIEQHPGWRDPSGPDVIACAALMAQLLADAKLISRLDGIEDSLKEMVRGKSGLDELGALTELRMEEVGTKAAKAHDARLMDG